MVEAGRTGRGHLEKWCQTLGTREKRRKRDRSAMLKDFWAGVGMIGLVGWSVVVPTLAGAALGAWIDEAFPGNFSWTLTLMASGLGIGCGACWRWLMRQSRRRGDGGRNDG